MRAIFSLSIIIYLTGCTTWINPRYPRNNEYQLSVDKNSCHSVAESSHPTPQFDTAVAQPSGYQTNTSCNSSGYGNVNCSSVTTPYTAPADEAAATLTNLFEIGMLIGNSVAQHKLFKDCMEGKGWMTQAEYKQLSSPGR